MSERYQRHSLIDWFSQESLARTKAIVVGAGAVGNEVLKNLALLGVGEIHVFDFDMIEEHNLTRSVLFRESHIGRPKAEVAAEQTAALDSNVTVSATHGDFWDHITFAELRSSDVLFCCVDNFEARIRCNTLCHLARLDFVNIGIDGRFALVELFPFSRSQFAGCLECNLPESVYRRISERYSCGYLRKLSFVEKKIPTTIVTSTVAASFAVSLGLRLGTDDDEPSARRLYIDTIGGSLTRTLLKRVKACPSCDRYEGKQLIMMSRREIGEWHSDWGGDATVLASEPILVSHRVGGRETVIFERASKFDSDFPATLALNPGAVELEVRDQFSMEELARRFSGRAMPCKFAIVIGGGKTLVCEFREEFA
jgi:molybdopterin/thiamine biosynthesis adenylyltransferase